jgi:ABC-type uncharacterized transport system substrate-binding protein
MAKFGRAKAALAWRDGSAMLRAMIAIRYRLLAATLAVALALPIAAAAHPHIFIEHRMQLLFDQTGVTGLRMVWRFDELYSSTLRTDYTDTPKGPITANDVQSLREHHFTPVAAKHFFAGATLNGEKLPLDHFTDFEAKFVDNKAVYSFTIPLKPSAQAAKNTLEVAVFDPEYYIDFELAAETPVKTTGGQKLAASCTNTTVSRSTIGWGEVDSDLVTCTYNGPSS